MTKSYDWIVVGAGFTGASLSYELAKQDLSVLLIEQHTHLQGATRYSYGGLAFWSGTTDLTRQICAEGEAIHRDLSAELEADTHFRDLDLLMTIDPNEDADAIYQFYQQFAKQPQRISPKEAGELEPLLNSEAIAAALVIPHGQIEPELATKAYVNAFLRAGGELYVGQATGLSYGNQAEVTGVTCEQTSFVAAHTVICAGAFSRALLKSAGIPTRVYFTHAEIIETAPQPDLQLRTMVSQADLKRFDLERSASVDALDLLWDEPGHEPVPPILDAGAIQLPDGRFRIGQLSRTLTDLEASVERSSSEAKIRAGVRPLLPTIADLPGEWCRCQIAYSADQLPLVGAMPGVAGLHLFTGFSSPLAIAPALARRFAAQAVGSEDPLLVALSPQRFGGAIMD